MAARKSAKAAAASEAAGTARRGPGEGTIRLRTDGRWEARVPVGNGRRVSVFGRTREECREKWERVLADRAAGRPAASQRLTVEAYLGDWLKRKRASVRPRVWRSYEQIVRTRIVPNVGRVPLARLSVRDVEDMLARLATAARPPAPRTRRPGMKGKKRAPLSAQSVKNTHAVLRSALSDALRDDLVPRNVAKIARAPHVEREPVRGIGPAEARAILDAVSIEALRERHGESRARTLAACYGVALALGLRQGEALALRWTDVDLDAGILRVERTIYRDGGTWRFSPPKSRTSRRTLPLDAHVVEVLRQHRAGQAADRLAAGTEWEGEDWGGLVFADERGAPLWGREVTLALQRALVAAGLPRWRFHDLRHHAAAIALAAGVPLKVVSERLGHSTIGITADIYTAVAAELQRDASEAVGAVLFGAPSVRTG